MIFFFFAAHAGDGKEHLDQKRRNDAEYKSNLMQAELQVRLRLTQPFSRRTQGRLHSTKGPGLPGATKAPVNRWDCFKAVLKGRASGGKWGRGVATVQGMFPNVHHRFGEQIAELCAGPRRRIEVENVLQALWAEDTERNCGEEQGLCLICRTKPEVHQSRGSQAGKTPKTQTTQPISPSDP